MKTWTIAQTHSFWVVTNPEGKSIHIPKSLAKEQAIAKAKRLLAARIARVGG